MDRLVNQRVACTLSESLTVNLELSITVDSKFGLKREMVRKDGTTRTQFLHVVDKSSLYDFATADPFEQKLLKHYERMWDQVTAEPTDKVVIGEPLISIGNLNKCANEFDLIEQVRAIVCALGGTQFIYHCLRFDSARSIVDPAHATYLIGCRPGWMQQYISNGWSLDDLYLFYTARNIEPVLTSTLNRDRVNHWFVQSARDNAFVRGLIAPAHFPRSGLLGMLHVGCPAGGEKADALLWTHRLPFQALSLAILAWHIQKARSDGIAKYDLHSVDVCVLQTYLIRKSAHDVADVTGVTVNSVYATHFKRINRKMGTERIALAAEKALAEGLLD